MTWVTGDEDTPPRKIIPFLLIPVAFALVLVVVIIVTRNGTNGLLPQVEHEEARLVGDKIVISYDLISKNQESKFDVSVYLLSDGSRLLLSDVSGDVGKGQIPGGGKKIMWVPLNDPNVLSKIPNPKMVAFEVIAEQSRH